jgi:hypothetical protein
MERFKPVFLAYSTRFPRVVNARGTRFHMPFKNIRVAIRKGFRLSIYLNL